MSDAQKEIEDLREQWRLADVGLAEARQRCEAWRVAYVKAKETMTAYEDLRNLLKKQLQEKEQLKNVQVGSVVYTALSGEERLITIDNATGRLYAVALEGPHKGQIRSAGDTVEEVMKHGNYVSEKPARVPK